VPEYAKHFTCISVDLRGTGESENSPSGYSTELLADDIAGLMQALGLQSAHVTGVSLGSAVGTWLAAKHPAKVKSLSLHSSWPKTELLVKTVVEGWQIMAEMTIRGIFPWCFTPELYATRPEYIQTLAEFVRGRPAQSLASFIQQSDAVINHDADGQLGKIAAPTQITFGRFDQVTSTRFADRLKQGIRHSELVVFEGCSHAPLYEKVEEFNGKTLEFLQRHADAAPRAAAV
jgi:pimeloyl-ACP methyl ester carboxylesterase